MQMAATDGTVASDGSGRMPFEVSAATLPGVSAPSSVVRSIIRTARSSANSFASRLIDRFASVPARSSSATASTEPIRGSRGSSGSSNPVASTGALAIRRSLALHRQLTGQRVLPALLPVERRTDDLLERHSKQQMLERPAVRRVRDQQDARAVELGEQVVQQAQRPLDDLPVALSPREGLVEPPYALGLDVGRGRAVQLPVVALAKPPVVLHGKLRPRKRDLRGLDGAPEIRREHDGETIVAAPLAELRRLLPAQLRQPALEPARRDPGLVVERRRVRLVDELDRHQMPSRSRSRSSRRHFGLTLTCSSRKTWCPSRCSISGRARTPISFTTEPPLPTTICFCDSVST